MITVITNSEFIIIALNIVSRYIKQRKLKHCLENISIRRCPTWQEKKWPMRRLIIISSHFRCR